MRLPGCSGDGARKQILFENDNKKSKSEDGVWQSW